MTTTVPADHPDWRQPNESAYDELATFTAQSLDPASTISLQVSKSYQALTLYLYNAGNDDVVTFGIDVYDTGGVNVFGKDYVRGIKGSVAQAFTFPILINAGNTFHVTLTGAVSGNTADVLAAGVINPVLQGVQLYRSDGRPVPTGDHLVRGTNTAGETLISAPGTGKHILIVMCHMSIDSSTGGAGLMGVYGTIGGTNAALMNVFAGASSAQNVSLNVPPHGLLLDQDTALTTQTANSPATVSTSVIYDIVS